MELNTLLLDLDVQMFLRLFSAAKRLGTGAGPALACGESSRLVGIQQGQVATTPLDEIVGIQKPMDPALFELAKVLKQ